MINILVRAHPRVYWVLICVLAQAASSRTFTRTHTPLRPRLLLHVVQVMCNSTLGQQPTNSYPWRRLAPQHILSLSTGYSSWCWRWCQSQQFWSPEMGWIDPWTLEALACLPMMAEAHVRISITLMPLVTHIEAHLRKHACSVTLLFLSHTFIVHQSLFLHSISLLSQFPTSHVNLQTLYFSLVLMSLPGLHLLNY